MKYPKAHIVRKLKLRAQQASDQAKVRTRQEEERYDNAITSHQEDAPEVRQWLAEAIKILANPHATGPDFERVKALIRRAERKFGGGSRIPDQPNPDELNGHQVRAQSLTDAAELLEAAEGDHVSTTELERLGILAHIKV